jgi:hypothetical protein
MDTPFFIRWCFRLNIPSNYFCQESFSENFFLNSMFIIYGQPLDTKNHSFMKKAHKTTIFIIWVDKNG